jgi:excinuclease ABC subunit B
LYGIGNPADYFENRITLAVGKNIAQEVFLRRLTDNLYVRNDLDLNRGYFRVKGDTVDIFLAYADYVLRVIFWDNEIEAITAIDPLSGTIIERFQEFSIYPANIFVPTKDRIQNAIYKIQDDLMERIDFFKEIGKNYEA